MSEEQPTFKVRDRRLFNPDGTPRDVEREESSDAADAPSTPASNVSDAAAASGSGSQRTSTAATAATASTAREPSREGAAERERVASAASAAGPSTSAATEPDQAEDLYTEEEEVPGADDPASFINFLMSIASNAAAALGMMEHPVTGQRGVDLPLAKHWIDVLGMLQQKTRGNLASQEEQIFQGLLSDLRLQYVSLTSAAPPAQGRGFTGRDIIGGK